MQHRGVLLACNTSDPLSSAFWVRIWVELNIVDDIEIQITIGINVYKSTATTELIAINAGSVSDIRKSAVSIVAIKHVWTVVRYI